MTLNGEKLLEAQTGTDGSLEIELPGAAGLVKIEAAFGDKDGEFEIELEEPGNLKITTTHFPYGQVGISYTITVEATGGHGSYTWSISEGDLPAGLTLDSATGVISGTPTTAGKYDLKVQVEDESDPGQIDTRKLSIQIKD
jgi:hypothetical protein